MKILKLMKNDISDQLAVLCDLSFTSASVLNILKTSKVTPIHKKHSKLECSNYKPVSLLSNIDKILERIVYNRLYKFFEDNKLIYNLQIGFQQKHSTTRALIHLAKKSANSLIVESLVVEFLLVFKKLLILLIIQFLPKS